MDWEPEIGGLVIGHDRNALIDNIFIKLRHGLSYYCQPFHCPISVEHLGLNYKVEYTDDKQGIMPESHNIWIPYTKGDIDNTFHRCDAFFPVSYFS